MIQKLTLLTILQLSCCLVFAQSSDFSNKMLELEKQEIESVEESSASLEVIKIVTNAPLPSEFDSNEGYLQAKEVWIKKNNEVYKKVTSRIPRNISEKD